MFVKYLIRFVVADDQVSPNDLAFLHALKGLQSIRVVECPEFRQLCMFLRETLVDNDIPRRTKMREGVISQWRESFEQLKLDLSVGIGIFSFRFINCLLVIEILRAGQFHCRCLVKRKLRVIFSVDRSLDLM